MLKTRHKKLTGSSIDPLTDVVTRHLAALRKIRAMIRRVKNDDRWSKPTARSKSHPLAPRELAGKWVAWSSDLGQIVAHGDTFAEVRDQVATAGAEKVSYEKLRPLSRSLSPQSQE